jgi:hypothetical protein
VQQFSRLSLRLLAPPIVPGSRLHVGVSGEPLHRANICAGIEQVADEGSPQIVR